MLFGVAWEYAELNIDTVAGSTYFVNVNDSLLDMLFNVMGTSHIVMNVPRVAEARISDGSVPQVHPLENLNTPVSDRG